MEKIKNNKKSIYEYKKVENEESLKTKYFYIKKREILVGDYSEQDRLVILDILSKKLSHEKKVAFINKSTYKKIQERLDSSDYNHICVSNGEAHYYEKNADGKWIAK